VFGIERRKVASIEKRGDKQGFIDLLWKDASMVEHKSAGRDLPRAKTPAPPA
jgi:hypothetical protein